jgi:MFS transporter, SP family, sugar:H+ symporter
MTTHPSLHLLRVTLLSAVAALGGFLFGYDSGVINGTVGALQKAFHTDDIGSGFNVASMLLGCAAGAFLAGRMADRFGRRAALFAAAILFGISAWGSGIATSSMEFVIYRLIGGFAVGGASVICPAYISEIAPAQYRGRLATLQQMAIVLGLFFAFLSNYLIAAAAGGASAVSGRGWPHGASRDRSGQPFPSDRRRGQSAGNSCHPGSESPPKLTGSF